MAESTTNELQAAAAAVRALRIERAAARRFLRTRPERVSMYPFLAPCSDAARRGEIAGRVRECLRIERRLEEAEAAVSEIRQDSFRRLNPLQALRVEREETARSIERAHGEMSIERAVALLTALADEDGNAREADRTPLSVASTELEAARTVTLACEAWVLQLARRACTESDAAWRQERRGGRLLETRDEARRALAAMDAADRLRADAAGRLGRAEREAEQLAILNDN